MPGKQEIILGEIGKEVINELLANDQPFTLFNFIDVYFAKVYKHHDRERLLKYIHANDYNFLFFKELILQIFKYYPEIKNQLAPIVAEFESEYPLSERSFKKISKKTAKAVKSLSEANLGQIINEFFFVVLKFIKKNFSINHIEKDLKNLEKELLTIKSPYDYRVFLKNLQKQLGKLSCDDKGGGSFLSSIFGKSDKERTDDNISNVVDNKINESLKDVIYLFVKNIDSFFEADQSIQEKIKFLEQKVSDLNSVDEIKHFKKVVKEIFYKLEFVRNSVEKEKEELKNIIFLMADSLKTFIGDSSDYGKELDEFIDKLKNTDDINEIKKLKYEIIQATIAIKEKTEHFKKELNGANLKIIQAQEKIKTLEKELEITKEKALYDGLTKAYNRFVFDDRIVKEVEKAKREDKTLYLIMLDIDHFKKINDTFGHQTGDMVLKILTSQIQKVIRDIDFFARYGGEEFSLLLPELDDELAKNVAERIRRKIEKTKFLYKKKEIKVTISLGLTKLKKNDTVKTFIERADKALYEAKNSGRNKVVFK